MPFDILKPNFCRIARRKVETDHTFTLSLEGSLSYLPGQFNMLYVFGVGEVPISVSGSEDNGHLLHTIKSVGNVTQALERLREGDVVGVRGPFGSSWPIDQCKGKDIVLVAGGIGLAPIRSLLYAIRQERKSFGQVALLYGARDPGDLLFSNELLRWIAEEDMEVKVTVDYADPSWTGNVGVVTNLIPRTPFALENAVGIVCGPEIMMRFAIRELLDRGMTETNLYLSMERNMKCAIGHCGRCQYVDHFVCKDGPVFSYDKVAPFFAKKEI